MNKYNVIITVTGSIHTTISAESVDEVKEKIEIEYDPSMPMWQVEEYEIDEIYIEEE